MKKFAMLSTAALALAAVVTGCVQKSDVETVQATQKEIPGGEPTATNARESEVDSAGGAIPGRRPEARCVVSDPLHSA